MCGHVIDFETSDSSKVMWIALKTYTVLPTSQTTTVTISHTTVTKLHGFQLNHQSANTLTPYSREYDTSDLMYTAIAQSLRAQLNKDTHRKLYDVHSVERIVVCMWLARCRDGNL